MGTFRSDVEDASTNALARRLPEVVASTHLLPFVLMRAPTATLANCALVNWKFYALVKMPLAVRNLNAKVTPSGSPWPAAITSLNINELHSGRDFALPHIKWLLANLPHLQAFSLNAQLFSEDAVVEVVRACAGCTTLTELRLTHALMHTTGASALASALPSLEGLVHLDIHGNKLTDRSFATLLPALTTLQHLTALDVSCSRVLRSLTEASIPDITALLDAIPTLKSLTVSFAPRSHLHPLYTQPLTDYTALWRRAARLETLSPGIIHHDPAHALATQLPSFTHLRALDLSSPGTIHNHLENITLHHGLMRAVAELTALTLLALRHHGASNAHDTGVLRHTLSTLGQLRHLDISCSSLYRQATQAGLEALALVLKRHSCLTFLGLGSFQKAVVTPSATWANFITNLRALRELHIAVPSRFAWPLFKHCSALTHLEVNVLQAAPAWPTGLDTAASALPLLQTLKLSYGSCSRPEARGACLAPVLRGLTAHATVTHLELDHDSGAIWSVACQHLQCLTRLHHLTVSMPRSTPHEMCVLARALQHLSRLTHLEISGLFGDDVHVRAARDPMREGRLLPFFGVSPAVAAELAEAFAHIPKLRLLRLGGYFNTDASVTHLAAGIWHLTALTSLDIYISDFPSLRGAYGALGQRASIQGPWAGPARSKGRSIGGPPRPAPKHTTALTMSEESRLSAVHQPANTCLEASLSRLRRLVGLTLSGRCAFGVCTALPSMRALTAISMRAVHMPDAAQLGAALGSLTQLGSFSMQHSSLGGPDGLDSVIAGLSPLTRLTELRMCDVGMSGENFRRLGAVLPRLQSLQVLEVGHNSCEIDDLLSMLGGLEHLTRLVRLEVPMTHPDDVDQIHYAFDVLRSHMPVWFSCHLE